MLLEIRKSRFDMLCKTGLIATGIENRFQLRDSLEVPAGQPKREESNMTREEIIEQIIQTMKKTKCIQ
ncbi:hypothetical protein C5Y96_20045 [Blastopirellula marina]|uniref:Uncharacterized protein n=1 Tax=Blastopirellula marina TaxID=124 RepID=A0A2S8F3M7_9BACT|nr:hypothetical protein C5Y96_20045 [Blastopirellula marina]RCS46255.1 hypothetical protein DTL36_20075 [Bremerella cremea]